MGNADTIRDVPKTKKITPNAEQLRRRSLALTRAVVALNRAGWFVAGMILSHEAEKVESSLCLATA